MAVARIYLAAWTFLAASLLALLYVMSHLHIHSLANQKPPLNRINLHPANMTVINLEQFQFLLNADHCRSTSPVSLLLLVHSAPGNWMARQAIRSSWGRYPSTQTRDILPISGLKYPERLLSLFFCSVDQILQANKWR